MSPTRNEVKVVLLGASGAGKTSLVDRYAYHKFQAEIPPSIGALFVPKKVIINDVEVSLGIWDTAGQERFASVAPLYYRGAHAAIICYDLTEQFHWEKVESWILAVRNTVEKCKFYLCGTKLDLLGSKKRVVDFKETSNYALAINATLFETSSKTGENIEDLFLQIARDCMLFGVPQSSNVSDSAKPEKNLQPPPTQEKESKCC